MILKAIKIVIIESLEVKIKVKGVMFEVAMIEEKLELVIIKFQVFVVRKLRTVAATIII